MVHAYEEATGDTEFVKSILPYMLEEFLYWQNNHSINVFLQNGVSYNMIRYNCQHNGPRPESYVEDYELVTKYCQTDFQKNSLYHELKTGAETGWDYSSRWFIKNATNQGELQDTKARSIVP